MKPMQRQSMTLKEIIYDNDSMREKFSVLTKMVMQAAESLNHLRQVSSARILNRVVDILKDMGMNNARMELHLVPAKEPVPNGALEMEFLFFRQYGRTFKKHEGYSVRRRNIQNCVSH